jgi:hypothetical protein
MVAMQCSLTVRYVDSYSLMLMSVCRLLNYLEYQRLWTRDALNKGKANGALDGIESCPFCTFECVMEVPADVDRGFRCYGLECGAVSCRLCQTRAHIPKTCKGMVVLAHFNCGLRSKR